jgi:hypothetical protein
LRRKKMTLKKNIYFVVAIAFFVWTTSGCVASSPYGKLGVSHWGEHPMTIAELHENWDDYHVYYSGVHKYLLGAIMFDPKEDGRKLVGHPWWTEVKDRELLSELLIWISFHPYPPDVLKIVGPDNEFYGYIYTNRSDVHIKKVDDRTLWVDELVEPPLVVEREGAVL